MNHITPPQALASQPVHGDRLREVLLSDTSIIGLVGSRDGETLAIDLYVQAYHFLNAEVRARARARLPVSRFFVDLARDRARRIARWFQRAGISETWEETNPDRRFRASFGERVAASCFTLAALGGVGASISVLATYLKSGPLPSLANADWINLSIYASTIFFAALATKALATLLSREAQRRLGLALGAFGLLGFLGWSLAAAGFFAPVQAAGDAASALLNSAPAGSASLNDTGGIGVPLLALHLLADWALGSTAFVAGGVVLAKGRTRLEARTSADGLADEMLRDAHQEWNARADALGVDDALSGKAYDAGLQQAIASGRSHYRRLLRHRNAAVAIAELEVTRSARSASFPIRVTSDQES